MALTVSLLSELTKIQELSRFDNTTAEGYFVITESPENHGEYKSVTVETQKCNTIGKNVKLIVFFNERTLQCGDIVKAKIKLSSLENSKYKKNNYSEQVYLSGNMSDIIINDNENELVLSFFGKVRKYITDTLFSKLSYEEAATINAIVQGDMNGFSTAFLNNIKCSGVSHVMVVSGMHLAIVVALFLKLSEKFIYNRFSRALIIFLTVVFLTALCGFTKSIFRAGITYLLMALSIILKRNNNPENTLGAAVLLILIFNPFAIFSLSFQLSVLSTFGILAVAIPVVNFLDNRRMIKSRILMGIISAVTVSLSAMLLTLPVTIMAFGYLSTVAIITNLLISTAVSLALSFAVMGLIINAVFMPFSQPFFLISGVLTKYINFIINKLGEYRYSTVDVGNHVAFITIMITVLILVFLLACKKRNDMIKLKSIELKVIKEGGGKLKWQ